MLPEHEEIEHCSADKRSPNSVVTLVVPVEVHQVKVSVVFRLNSF